MSEYMWQTGTLLQMTRPEDRTRYWNDRKSQLCEEYRINGGQRFMKTPRMANSVSGRLHRFKLPMDYEIHDEKPFRLQKSDSRRASFAGGTEGPTGPSPVQQAPRIKSRRVNNGNQLQSTISDRSAAIRRSSSLIFKKSRSLTRRKSIELEETETYHNKHFFDEFTELAKKLEKSHLEHQMDLRIEKVKKVKEEVMRDLEIQRKKELELFDNRLKYLDKVSEQEQIKLEGSILNQKPIGKNNLKDKKSSIPAIYFKINNLAKAILPEGYINRKLTLRDNSDTIIQISNKKAGNDHDMDMVKVEIEQTVPNKLNKTITNRLSVSPYKLKGNSYIERARFVNLGHLHERNNETIKGMTFDNSFGLNRSTVSEFASPVEGLVTPDPLDQCKKHLPSIPKFKIGRKAPLRHRPQIYGGNLMLIESCDKMMTGIKMQMYAAK